MNEELQKQLAESIKDFAASIGAAKSFAIGQAPDVIQQYLAWGIAESALTIVFAALVVCLSYLMVFKFSPQEHDDDGNWHGMKVASLVIGGILSLGFTITAIISIFNLLEIYIAPKVWLIQQAALLIHHN